MFFFHAYTSIMRTIWSSHLKTGIELIVNKLKKKINIHHNVMRDKQTNPCKVKV